MLSVEQIETYYTYFYRKVYKDQKYRFNKSKTTYSVCESFLKIVDKKYSLHSIGESFLWDYFIFQFNYWDELTLQNQFTDKVVIAWIVGKKAFQRWEERDMEYDWQMETYPIVEKYGVQKSDLFMELKDRESSYDSSKAIRKQYLNTEKGFQMCIAVTTLYDPKDMSCIKCENRSDCKELLRVNYPNLYKQRIN